MIDAHRHPIIIITIGSAQRSIAAKAAYVKSIQYHCLSSLPPLSFQVTDIVLVPFHLSHSFVLLELRENRKRKGERERERCRHTSTGNKRFIVLLCPRHPHLPHHPVLLQSAD